MTNTLYYGDNLEVLREHIADASVDLIYLDPPFNSNASYNVLFRAPSGGGTDASIEAFDDTWAWGPAAEDALADIRSSGNHKLHTLMAAIRTALGDNALMAYLAMMAVRLIELHRVLKPTGSLYLHCDPTASHYLKLVLDAVFGADNYRNELIWKRTTAHSDTKGRFSHESDTIFFYSKSAKATWHTQFGAHAESYVNSHYRHTDDLGRKYRHDNIIRSASMGPRPNLAYDYKGFTPPCDSHTEFAGSTDNTPNRPWSMPARWPAPGLM